ncbi:MAG: Dabb family protein [Saprospiraceae bacterium]|nr:Dabb family protein [Saprospiraceae bacterium]MCB9307721.1 Dabb family protein [Lewinellaceae bacterium]MCB9353459.1 Dabb family protein [Lewinellaceae bacterium]
MFVHHVFFWMAPGASDADRQKLAAGIQSLAAIEQIRTSHLGMPADTHREVIDRSYDFSWLAIFDSPEDEELYQKHPIHLKFVDECWQLWQKVVVYDAIDR